MIVAIAAIIAFFAVGFSGWFLVDISHLGGNSRRPVWKDYLPVFLAAIVAALVAGAVAAATESAITWIWSFFA